MEPKAPNFIGERLIRIDEVISQTGLNRASVYRESGFPRPIKVSARASAWIESEVQSWIQQQISRQRS